jgi:PAS domain S-box-containing protein
MNASKNFVVIPGSTTPSPTHDRRDHSVHFYRSELSLIDAAAEFVSTAVVNGGSAIMVATSAHREALWSELEERNLDMSRLCSEGRYVPLDAVETLAQFMVDGLPDERRFEKVLGDALTTATFAAKSHSAKVAVFGEMVAVLWTGGNYEAAVHLERLWNQLLRKRDFLLRCAYPMAGFRADEHGEWFAKVCDEHLGVIPEGGLRLLDKDETALRTVAKLQQKVEALEHKKALHESEQRFRLLVEAVEDYAIFMLDAEGNIASWNIGAERIKGYKASEIIGQHFSRFYPEEDVRAGKPERELEIARREGRVEDEGWLLRKDGSKLWALVVITALKDSAGTVIGFAKVTRDFTERMIAQQRLEDSERRLKESEGSLRRLSVRLLQTQDEERRRIARDLHDSLGQVLSVLKLKLDGLANSRLAADPDDAKRIALMVELTEEAVKEVRTISYLLYPPMLEELGLKSAVAWYLDGFSKRSSIKTSFSAPPKFPRLAGDVELVLFRVLQESLTNVHRHSGSPTAEVELLLKDDTAILQVGDRGKGLQDSELEQSLQDWTGAFGVGLRGMSERLRQVGGSLTLTSGPQGTTVRAMVPAGENHRRLED